MFGFASPSPYATFSPAAFFTPQPSTSSSPFQYGCSPYAKHQQYESDSDSDDLIDYDGYHAYMDAARREREERERRELEEAQARRRAKEERAYLAAKARAQAEAEARARAKARAQAQAEAQARAREQARAAAEAEYRRRQELESEYRRRQQLQMEARARAQEEERQRRIHQTRDQDEMARQFFSNLFGLPVPQPTPVAGARSSSPAVTPVHDEPVVAPSPDSHSTVKPAVIPISSSESEQSKSASQQAKSASQQPKMNFDDAVRVIQSLAKSQIAIRQRLRSIGKLRDRFEELKRTFSEPEVLDFDLAQSASTSSPVLAYTANNKPIRAHEEALIRLLTDLDGISSGGFDRVKNERKALAKAIEAELARLDGIKLALWQKQVSERSRSQDTEAMETDNQDINAMETDHAVVGDSADIAEPAASVVDPAEVPLPSEDGQPRGAEDDMQTGSQVEPAAPVDSESQAETAVPVNTELQAETVIPVDSEMSGAEEEQKIPENGLVFSASALDAPETERKDAPVDGDKEVLQQEEASPGSNHMEIHDAVPSAGSQDTVASDYDHPTEAGEDRQMPESPDMIHSGESAEPTSQHAAAFDEPTSTGRQREDIVSSAADKPTAGLFPPAMTGLFPLADIIQQVPTTPESDRSSESGSSDTSFEML